jgi:hypothetical protein
MVPVMRRYIALMVACAVLAFSFGCQHIGGKCDCGFNPDDYHLQPPTNPHASAPAVKPMPKTGGNEE